MGKNLHKQPFDEGTKAKLAIFQDYIREWLPVFLSKREVYWKSINIYDFFAGPGSDIKGAKGTPLIILDEIAPYHLNITTKDLTVTLYFNEFDKSKADELRTTLLSDLTESAPYSFHIDNLDFREAFEKEYSRMSQQENVNLLFLDQNGIKQITEETFKKIIDLKRTDFLFFISSSTIRRFSEHPSIKQYIKMDANTIDKTPYYKIHRLVLEYYKSLVPANKEYYLAPFSLKKGTNIYGLIFGSGHVLGIEKFLGTCWKLDPERGEANFDIDEDNIQPGQLDIFTQTTVKPKKVDLFEKELEEKILTKQLKTDKEIYLFTLSNGFTVNHSKAVIKKLMDKKKIMKTQLVLSSKICRAGAALTEIEIL